MEKLISELRTRADKALKKKRDYSLSDILSDATRRADLREHRAWAILLSAIGVNPDSATAFAGFPEHMGVMVKVRSFSLGGADGVRLNPQYGGSDLPAIGVGAGRPLGRRAVAEPMTHYLAREMERLKRVSWVGVRPRPQMKPDCKLRFDILTLSTRWRQVSPAGAQETAEFVLNVGMQIHVNL